MVKSQAYTTLYINVFQIFMMMQLFHHITPNFGGITDNMIDILRHGYK